MLFSISGSGNNYFNYQELYTSNSQFRVVLSIQMTALFPLFPFISTLLRKSKTKHDIFWDSEEKEGKTWKRKNLGSIAYILLPMPKYTF